MTPVSWRLDTEERKWQQKERKLIIKEDAMIRGRTARGSDDKCTHSFSRNIEVKAPFWKLG
jgi:hypothetical protein